ncbi:hypothetical protein ACDQ56_08340 [Fusobacterium animalis]|uniref:hypothetical protein n=1 Tax=Fusobacterium animalis TaxID=76859 RepID=UPI003556164E
MNSLPFYYFSELKEYLDITKMSYSNPMKFSDPNEWILPDSELLKEVGIRCFYTFEPTDKRSPFEIIKDLKEKFLKNNQNLGSFEIGFTYAFDKATIVVENIKEKEKYNNPNITTYTKAEYSNSMISNKLELLWNKNRENIISPICYYNTKNEYPVEFLKLLNLMEIGIKFINADSFNESQIETLKKTNIFIDSNENKLSGTIFQLLKEIEKNKNIILANKSQFFSLYYIFCKLSNFSLNSNKAFSEIEIKNIITYLLFFKDFSYRDENEYRIIQFFNDDTFKETGLKVVNKIVSSVLLFTDPFSLNDEKQHILSNIIKSAIDNNVLISFIDNNNGIYLRDTVFKWTKKMNDKELEKLTNYDHIKCVENSLL